MLFWVYFRGTRNGEYIEAENMKSAKWILALKHGLNSGSKENKVITVISK